MSDYYITNLVDKLLDPLIRCVQTQSKCDVKVKLFSVFLLKKSTLDPRYSLMIAEPFLKMLVDPVVACVHDRQLIEPETMLCASMV